MSSINKESLAQLKSFIDLCEAKPEILWVPELLFFKKFIESYGGTVPPPPEKKSPEPSETTTDAKPKPTEPETPSSDEMESDSDSPIEFDTTDCVEPDEINEQLQVMGDSDKQPTEEEIDKADEKRQEAMSALGEGNTEKAIELFGDAIQLNPQSSILFAKRGQAFLRQSKPNACIKDCTRALELNCDSAAGYKFRGRAYRLIGEWEKAALDLRQAVKIDYDEQADEWLKEVQPNAQKIEQQRLKHSRKKYEKTHSHESHQSKPEQSSGFNPFMGEQPPPEIYKLLQDPEIFAAIQDPEVMLAFQEVSSNPEAMKKYQDNPKVKKVLEKFAEKMKAQFGQATPNEAGESQKATAADKVPNTTDDDALD